MCSTSFLQVTDESGMTLADLIPTGYKGLEEFENEDAEGFRGKLIVKVLNNGGGIETDGANKDKCYAFYAPWEDEWGTPFWTQISGGTPTRVSDPSKVQFPIGTGLWIEMSTDAYFNGKYPDNQYKIQHSGAAMLDARQVELRPGKKGVSITVSSDITLANIHPMGYLGLEEFENEDAEGFRGKLVVKVLNNGGGIETDTAGKDKCYAFYAPWEDEWGTPFWTQISGGTPTRVSDPSKVQFPIGTGLWIEMSTDAYFNGKYPDNQYKVEFDGIENL